MQFETRSNNLPGSLFVFHVSLKFSKKDLKNLSYIISLVKFRKNTIFPSFSISNKINKFMVHIYKIRSIFLLQQG